jgi:hypothetical protein
MENYLDSKVILIKLEELSRHVETIIRGSASSLAKHARDSILEVGTNLFSAISSENFTAIYSKLEILESELYTTAAVKLHNKARNLTNESFHDIRGLLRGVAAWILIYFSKSSSAGKCTIIKLLSKSNQDLQQFENFRNFALKCCVGVAKMWSELNQYALNKQIPQIELQEVKVAVFQAYLDVVKLSDDDLDVCNSISKARDMVQSMSKNLKVTFSDYVVQYATKCAEKKHYNDAIKYFNIALQTVQLILSLHHRRNEQITSSTTLEKKFDLDDSEANFDILDYQAILKSKLAIELSLAFSFNEIK